VLDPVDCTGHAKPLRPRIDRRRAMVFASLAAKCHRCAEDPLIISVQISETLHEFTKGDNSDTAGNSQQHV
jgi:hypothetical protein